AKVGDRLLVRQRLLLAAAPDIVDRDIAPDHDQPRRRIARRAVLRPAFQRAQAGVLEGFLGGIEVAEIAQQRADRLGTRRGQRRVDPGGVGHADMLPEMFPEMFPGVIMPTGRISYAPPGLAAARSRATSSASSRFLQSTT